MKPSNLAILVRLEELKTERLMMEVANVTNTLECGSPEYSADHFEGLAARINSLHQDIEY